MTLKELIEAQKRKSFVTPENTTDPEALGLVVSHHFEWDGLKILETFFFALEDANFHTEAAQVQEMIEAEKSVA